VIHVLGLDRTFVRERGKLGITRAWPWDYRRAAARSSAWEARTVLPLPPCKVTPVMMERGGRPLYDV